ncbi:metallophosphoesterase family protein [Halocatena halophila]|uniref:metallophosphoesterase family protein n=1 Tax=Halocatena halophila TaxID=2814576 RepID=UPI002ED20D0A
MGVRFLHVADLHVGQPLECGRPTDGELDAPFRRCGLRAIERIISVARTKSVDFVVVSGDVFDRQYRSVELTEQLLEILEKAGCSVYILGGDSPEYSRISNRWPGPVRCFDAKTVETFEHGIDRKSMVRLTGQSNASDWPASGLFGADSSLSGPSVGVIHRPPGRTQKTVLDASQAFEMDYWAGGGPHRPRYWPSIPGGVPGSPQPRRFDARHVGGCYLVELIEKSPSVTFIPTAPISFHTVTVALGSEDDEPIRTIGGVVTDALRSITSLQERPPRPSLSLPDGVARSDGSWAPAGMVVRIELTGHSPIVTQLTRSRLDWLFDRIRSLLDPNLTPVVLESIRDRTRRTGSDRSVAVVDALERVVDTMRTNERSQLRAATGEVFQDCPVGARETVPVDRCALTDQTLDRLTDEALALATDRLVERGIDVD